MASRTPLQDGYASGEMSPQLPYEFPKVPRTHRGQTEPITPPSNNPRTPTSAAPMLYSPSDSQTNLTHVLHPPRPDYAIGCSPQRNDVERGRSPARPAMPESQDSSDSRPPNSRGASWDVLNSIRKFEHSYTEFDSRNASEAHLVFADGDIPKNKVCC